MRFKKIHILCLVAIQFGFISISYGQKINSGSDRKKQTEKSTISVDGYKKFEKKNQPNKIANDSLDQLVGNYFTSSKYRFKVKLINNWKVERDQGDFPVVIQCYQQDSGKKVGVLVYDFPNIKFEDGISEDLQFEELQKVMTKIITDSSITIKDYNYTRIKFSNVPAILLKYYFIQKYGDDEIHIFNYQYLCFKYGRLYNVTISLPSVFFDDNEVTRIGELINSFQFY